MGISVVDVESDIVTKALTETELRRVVIRAGNSSEGGQRRVLRMEEAVVELGDWLVIQKCLDKRVVSNVEAAYGTFSQQDVNRLRVGERRIAQDEIRDAREEVLEIGKRRNGIDRRVGVTVTNQVVNG